MDTPNFQPSSAHHPSPGSTASQSIYQWAANAGPHGQPQMLLQPQMYSQSQMNPQHSMQHSTSPHTDLVRSQAPNAPFPFAPNVDGPHPNHTMSGHPYLQFQPVNAVQPTSHHDDQLLNHISGLTTRLDAQEAMNQELQAANTAQAARLEQHELMMNDLQHKQKPTKAAKSTSSRAIKALVHKIMLRLIAIEPLTKGHLPQLPHPLTEGESSRQAEDGTTLHNPDWPAGAAAPTCTNYVRMTAELALQQEKSSPSCKVPPDELNIKMFLEPAKKYFKSLRETYQAQNSPRAKKKKTRHLAKVRRRSRKVGKADMCRKAIAAIKERHGEENVVGIDYVFHTDCMTSEYSDADEGNLSEGAWKTHRATFIVGHVRAFERRRKMWKSTKYRRLQVYALNISRELSNSGQGQSQDHIPRFPCHTRNINDGPPRIAANRKTVYAHCVSDLWIARTGSQLPLEPTPATFTLFDFVVPDNALNAADLAYLKEYEDLARELEEEKATDGDIE
ncbi:hypothetical protein HYPSUDRAFT_203238 [Hypholoma sublateritium FD-334 SS-4]|uniref:Uncharacterized protein n=1 Tax=Hypholoma sublateritium (strain FD-334 SS-4) TaxID=945553 RepID=A0A0D2L2S1_HYPSF|nr:hypothetical protein HYPSUDRAFT_203238 [Hypholoma sublateritium FD-334 SS-4]